MGPARADGHPAHPQPARYAEARQTLEELSAALATFVTGMEKATGNEAMAACLNGLTGAMKPLVPRIKAMNERHPELASEATHPEELKPLLEKVDKGFQGLIKAYARIAAGLEDPVLRDADQRYREVMTGLK